MCVACGTALNISQAPSADRERAFIRRRIAEGLTKDEIKDALVAEYGPKVLAEPRQVDRVAGPGPDRRAGADGRRLHRAPLAQRRPTPRTPDAPASTDADARPPRARTWPATTCDAATSVDTTVFAAFAVGFVSFISPCVLPLVPGYLCAVSGVTSPTSMKAGQEGPRRPP